MPITAEPGFAQYPSFCPGGKEFDYEGWRDGGLPHIYFKRIGAASPIRLTSETSTDYNPVCSPDGKQVAFHRIFGDADEGVLVMGIAGGEPKILFRVGAINGLIWSHDGRAFIVSHSERKNAPRRLRQFSISSRNWLDLTHPAEATKGDLWPNISADGSKLVFVRYDSTISANLSVLNINPDLSARGEPRVIAKTTTRVARDAPRLWSIIKTRWSYEIFRKRKPSFHL